MYILHDADLPTLRERARLFDQHMEPLLKRCDAALQAGRIPATLPEIPQYLQVCRWLYRRLEYAFALDALLEHLTPGQRFLDAGSGATPLSHAMAALGMEAEACDGEKRLIAELQALRPETIYGSFVRYSAQDLTAMAYPSDSFDGIACISVLEHIPAPFDQQAMHELIRVLRPGGILVMTVDFSPQPAATEGGRVGRVLRRTVDLARQGDLLGILKGVQRKFEAQRVVSEGKATLARSANQPFEPEHLHGDLLAELADWQAPSRLAYPSDLFAVTTADAQNFWRHEPDVFPLQGRRLVLPAAVIIKKPSA